jgi:hypothetical protein
MAAINHGGTFYRLDSGNPLFTPISRNTQEYSYLFLSLNNKIVPFFTIDHFAEKFNVNKADRPGGMVC